MHWSVVARAPGRVNLIGEHTDYNDGFVLPMGLPFDTAIEARPRDDALVVLRSEGYGETSFSLADDPEEVAGWARYIAGMARFMAEDGLEVGGFDATITTTIPVGASLSSSAALEVAAGFALCGLAGADPDPISIARCGQRVENEIVGLNSGIMDQLISATAIDGSALLIDCRDLSFTPTPLPESTAVLIMDTMTRRELVDSEYDARRASCERAAAAMGVTALRDADLAGLDEVPDPVDQKRARHVIEENARVLAAVDALGRGDAAEFGRHMNASHESLSTLYEVSSPALDSIAAHARDHDGCFGARMTGGGFAGCAVALVRGPAAEEVTESVRRSYGAESGTEPDIWTVRPSAGATVDIREDHQ